MSDVLLKVEELRVAFRAGRKRLEAVRGVSLEARRGRCLGVVGESGSGKSTMARALLGLEDDVGGRVEFEGRDVLKMGPAELRAFRRRAQMVFQDPMGSLNPRMRAGAALEEVMRVHGIAATKAEAARAAGEWFETVGLDGAYADRFPHELSGGQRQRVNLARSLCVGAEFLVADEPVSALDVSVQAQILNLLKTLQERRGITWMLIGHDLAVMRHMADEIVVMKDGKIVERGLPGDVLGAPQHGYTRELLESAPDVERSLARRGLGGQFGIDATRAAGA